MRGLRTTPFESEDLASKPFGGRVFIFGVFAYLRAESCMILLVAASRASASMTSLHNCI